MADLTTYDPLFLAAFTNADGTGELAGSGYARVSVTNDTSTWSIDGGTGARTSIIPLDFPVATGAWSLVQSVGFYDLSTGGTLLAYVAVEPTSVATGQGLTFLAGALGYTAGDPGAVTPADPALFNIPRSLYLYENRGVPNAGDVLARTLYANVNRGVWNTGDIEARSLYLDENRGVQALEVLARAVYAYEATRDGEVSPWLMKLKPTEQYRGGQVSLYGDGFGELLEAAAGATITTSSVSGGNVGGNTVDRAAAEWISTDTVADAWIRFTFGAAKTIVGIALEARVTDPTFGAPTFRFSDGGPDVVGAALGHLAVLGGSEYPVGAGRVY